MPQVQHIVLLQFKPEVTDETIADLFCQIEALSESIPGILMYSSGENNSPEGLNQNCTHGFVMLFESVEARDNYLPHPKHEKVKQALLAVIESAVVFDYEML